VLPRASAEWFNQHRGAITGLTDVFYLMFAAAAAAGLAFAVAERRWGALVPFAFAVALAATYALFVAEPRYRLTTEVLLFPLAAFGLVRVAAIGGRAWSSLTKTIWDRLPDRLPGPVRSWLGSSRAIQVSAVEKRGLQGTLLVIMLLALGAVVVVRGGAALREGHRWATTVCRVDGQPWLALWHQYADDGGSSPVRGTSTGAVLALSPERREVSAEILLPKLALPRGSIRVVASIAWQGEPAPGTRVAIGSGSAVVGSTATTATTGAAASQAGSLAGWFEHPGGQVRFVVRVVQPPEARRIASAVIENVLLTTTPTTPTTTTTAP
jgi:hypothetical protein